MLGVSIDAPDRVWVGGEFTWGEAITVVQHGVVVQRDADEIRIDFPSGHCVALPADPPWQLVTDPAPVAPVADESEPPELPVAPLPSENDDDGRLIIDVDNVAEPEPEPATNELSAADQAPDDDDDDPPAP